MLNNFLGGYSIIHSIRGQRGFIVTLWTGADFTTLGTFKTFKRAYKFIMEHQKG